MIYLKPQSRSQTIENILVAIDMVKSLRPHRLYPLLEAWGQKKDSEKALTCGGGKMCFGGWVAVNPHFRKKGVRAEWEEYGEWGDASPISKDENGKTIYPSQVAEILFGSDDDDLFGYLPPDKKGLEKKVLLEKLKEALDKQLLV